MRPGMSAAAKRAAAALRKTRNQQAAARHLGITRNAFRYRLETARRMGVITAREIAEFGELPKGQRADPTRALERECASLRAEVDRLHHARKTPWRPAKVVKRTGKDDIVRVLMPDSHGIYADPGAMALFFADLKRLQPDEIIMHGDHVDCAGFLAQHHTVGFVPQLDGYSYEQDIAACNGHLDAMQQAAPSADITYIEGNHEDRVERWCVQQALGNGCDAEGLRQRNAPQYLLHLKERGIPYVRRCQTYDHLPIPGAIRRGKCIYIHDPGFGDPTRILARFGCSVSYGHTHTARVAVCSTVASEAIGAYNPGCLAKIQQYYNHSRPTGHTHGYGLEVMARTGHFLRFNVPLIGGASYLDPLLRRGLTA